MEFEEKVLGMAKLLSGKKAADILVINVADKTIICDYFLIATGGSTTHVKSLCDELEAFTAKEGTPPRRIEGYSEGRWIVLDYGDVLVHLFHPEERAFYNIERLWSDNGNLLRYVD